MWIFVTFFYLISFTLGWQQLHAGLQSVAVPLTLLLVAIASNFAAFCIQPGKKSDLLNIAHGLLFAFVLIVVSLGAFGLDHFPTDISGMAKQLYSVLVSIPAWFYGGVLAISATLALITCFAELKIKSIDQRHG